jgi:hypothetical protein
MPCISDEKLTLGWKTAQNSLKLYNDNDPLRELINGWFEDRAWKMLDCNKENSFEPFIFLWIAFNAWGTCVTKKEQDADIIDHLSRNPILRDDFRHLLNGDRKFQDIAMAFGRRWPVFSVMRLRRQHVPVQYADYTSRKKRICYYFGELGGKTILPKTYSPTCWEVHSQPDGSVEVPLDWPHTLYGLCHSLQPLSRSKIEILRERPRSCTQSFPCLGHVYAQGRIPNRAEEIRWAAA